MTTAPLHMLSWEARALIALSVHPHDDVERVLGEDIEDPCVLMSEAWGELQEAFPLPTREQLDASSIDLPGEDEDDD
jgi:hypothetical protein